MKTAPYSIQYHDSKNFPPAAAGSHLFSPSLSLSPARLPGICSRVLPHPPASLLAYSFTSA
jgi:hypothetical protein